MSDNLQFGEAIEVLKASFGDPDSNLHVADLFEEATRLKERLRTEWSEQQAECESAFTETKHKIEGFLDDLNDTLADDDDDDDDVIDKVMGWTGL